ncbi:hypothetical protein AU184_07135 [Mycolicibacterium novocastrense]|uniref:Uncharacterized protein n=1 Tax=Mycolicibacterium novocastrense TaxID=59813 RepID=A0AAW5SJ92_MYCNV|nr:MULTISPECIES: hypothetical protein [Mycobacteriaceae]KUH73635.1 hypothetical protein AU183_25055 [Mycolicibacterium novocastrense]KUH74728.1 hypothetical protein AU072_12125 [Mycolicibacterium novocastrense]KUH76042.1 hypothetical protein AU184_07135 [Mycolicibacterium novocastrense]MCV7023289.1 hypothetical protein [Mycolicibacterium novocastrense]OBF88739.1 hypothetical protein A5790_22400 [Mycobacterium sp. 852002-51152_SCH6134967]
MPHLFRAAAAVIAGMTAIATAPPVAADPMNPIPGNGFFLVGPDIAPGVYNTAGSASTWGEWFTNSTPDANKDNVVATNMSIGPMNANINSSVKAFESRNCQPWRRLT